MDQLFVCAPFGTEHRNQWLFSPPLLHQFGVDPTLVLPAAKSITTEPIASSCRDQTDHTGSRAPKSVGVKRGVAAQLALPMRLRQYFLNQSNGGW
jgi:hypothetical protein